MMSTDMVEVCVAGYREQTALADQRNLFAQTDHTHTGIDQQVPIAAAYMPDIAAIKRFDMGFENMRDAGT